MNEGKNLGKIFPLMLTLLVSGNLGLAIASEVAEAKPPERTPARGDRCRADNGRFDNRYCARNHDRRSRNNDRDDDLFDFDRHRGDRGTIDDGTAIEVEYAGSRRLVLYPGRTTSVTLRVIRAVRDNNGRVLIPSRSRIQGEFRPTGNDFRFVARRAILTNGRSYRINASSRIIDGDRRVASRDLSSITIGQTAIVIGRDRDPLIIYPGTDLELIVRSDLRIR
jgi:hypothetical protein